MYAPVGHWTYTTCAAHLEAVDRMRKQRSPRALTISFASVSMVDLDGVDALGSELLGGLLDGCARLDG